jgi:hypothetical protein
LAGCLQGAEATAGGLARVWIDWVIGWLLAATADIAGSCCCVSVSLTAKTLGVKLGIRGNMGQCES